ncbi:MAG: transposase [Clostridia bacterium]|nr:transposase [Clostridia bacterium]MBO5913180.1 transposase [Clostridia bacterium]
MNNNFKQRKNLRLKEYNYSSAGLYFITFCVKNRAKILSTVVGGGALDAPQVILTPVGKIVEKYILSSNNIENLLIYNYVIMPDHVHLLMGIQQKFGTSKAPSPTNEIIPHSISTLKRFVNKEIGTNIFQRSFYDHVVRNEEDLEDINDYIIANPYYWACGNHDDSNYLR